MKILTISDIHLRNYHLYNKFPNQRLKSYLLLAEDLVKIGKDLSIDIMFVAGDLIDKNTLTPIESHYLFKMFKILSEHFTIYSIIGNHDAKSKKSIDTEDTVITLLEEIGNIHFVHQKVLEFGGRKVAFENWMPEYDLSWIEDPVDVYISHAAIDYEDSGLFGMDTSVFDGKFELGLFGDIHMPKQLGNLVSIGNTKQESLSDRYQGNALVLDLEDLSYERIPIDPEHKKYLHLETTVVEEEEGWADLEGEDMTYRVFRPEKISGKSFEFSLPEITDIESRTSSVMSEVGLMSIHEDIKNNSVYNPIDFNFDLVNLKVHNFRSIAEYSLDFSEDFIITGHNGSGKSTLITALFYALIGKKTLKKDIKFGEKDCSLQVSLYYQNLLYIIKRGTATGDYMLSIEGEVQKYNSKLEFEKDVLTKLPFLEYHESFFFNYWDTELLGSVKLDRRYDLLCKYYRLDSLSSYNDIAEARFKSIKKEYKELQVSLDSLNVLVESRQSDYDESQKGVEGKPSKRILESKLEEHKEHSYKSSKVDSLEKEKLELESELESKKEEINNISYLLKTTSESRKTSLTKEELSEFLDSHSKYEALSTRLTNGSDLIKSEESKMESNRASLVLEKEKLKSLGSTTKPIGPVNEKVRYSEVSSIISDLKSEYKTQKIGYEYEVESLKKSIDEDEVRLEKFNNSSEEDSTCPKCSQALPIEDLIISLKDSIKSKSKTLESIKGSIETLDNKYTSEIIPKLGELEGELEKLNKSIILKNSELEKWLKDEELRSSLNSNISKLELDLESTSTKLDSYKAAVKSIKDDLANLSQLTREEVTSYSLELDIISRLDSTKDKLDKLKGEFKSVEKPYLEKIEVIESKISTLNKELSLINKLDMTEYSETVSLIAKYESLELLTFKLKEAKESRDEASSELKSLGSDVDNLDSYCQLTSRSGQILKSILDDLTKTFSSGDFRFTTVRTQATGKVVTDMSIDYLVGSKWVPYTSLSSGQRTLCDLYYISKVVTGVGVISFDETLRFLDDENLKVAATLINSMKKNNLLISSHSSNLSMEGTKTLSCSLGSGGTTEISIIQ